MGLVLDDWQRKFLETKGDKILCTGRQVGKSVVCGIDAGEFLAKNVKVVVLMIAPTERQAYALFDKTLAYLVEKYKAMISKGKDRPTKTRIKLTNGSELYCLPVGLSGVGIRFITINRLYVDEASRVMEDVWTAVQPALLTTGGDSIYLSTPFGKQGEFYRCWINQDQAYDSFTRFSVNSEEVMANRIISISWTERQREKALIKLEQAKTRMSKREYAQEYLGRFEDSLMRFFQDELIKKCCVYKRPSVVVGKTYLGCDIARMGEDEGTFEIIEKVNRELYRHVESIITMKTFTTETEEKIISLNKAFHFKKIGIDAGSGTLGVSVLDHLLRVAGLNNKVIALNNRARVLDRDEKSKVKLMKEDMYSCLLALMEQGKIELLDDDEVIESLRSIQYEYVTAPNKETRLRVFGDYSHVCEGLIRAVYVAFDDKTLNLWAR